MPQFNKADYSWTSRNDLPVSYFTVYSTFKSDGREYQEAFHPDVGHRIIDVSANTVGVKNEVLESPQADPVAVEVAPAVVEVTSPVEVAPAVVEVTPAVVEVASPAVSPTAPESEPTAPETKPKGKGKGK